MNLSSTLRAQLGRISLGGRITIVLALVWSAAVCLFLSHGALASFGEPIALYLTYPLADLNPIGGIINRRGVLGLDFFLTACAMMIPNLFILGYTAAGICKLAKWLVMWPFTRAGSRGAGPVVLLLSLLLCLSGVLSARSEQTPVMSLCRELETSIQYEVLHEGKPLPTTWDEIPMVHRMRYGPATVNPKQLELINTLALVPGAPLVELFPGAAATRPGWRLFAISRAPFTDDSTRRGFFEKERKPGRYALTLDPESKEIRLQRFLEPQAAYMVRQVPGFDPQEQPRALEMHGPPSPFPPPGNSHRWIALVFLLFLCTLVVLAIRGPRGGVKSMLPRGSIFR